jgi:hypothetical protein
MPQPRIDADWPAGWFRWSDPLGTGRMATWAMSALVELPPAATRSPGAQP